MRTIIALSAAAGLLVSLAGCATSAPSGTCTPSHGSGDASSIVTAEGAFGLDPNADFPTPLLTEKLEVSTLVTGDGATVHPGEYANVQVTLYDGATGEYLTSTAYDEGTPFTVRAGESSSKIGYAVECQAVGSRLAVAATGADLIGFAGITETTVGAEDTWVLVIDIQSSLLGKAYGVEQLAQQGLPAVVTTPDGQPGVTVPGEDPPTSLKVAVLKQADGEPLKEGDRVYLHFLRLDWITPTSSKSTWDNYGVPQLFSVSDLDPATGAGMPPGMLQALVGKTVGSQVLLVMPPAYGFPDGAAPDGVEAGSTLIYVLDILGVAE